MADTAPLTVKDLESLETRLDKRFGDVANRFDEVAKNFEATDKRFDDVLGILQTFMGQVSDKFEQYDEEFRKLNNNYNHLLNAMDAFISRIEISETELAARDRKIDRLEKYIEVLAEKAGVDLNTIPV